MKNKIFAIIIVIAGILLAALWKIEHGHRVERDRLDRQYQKQVMKLESNVQALALKAQFLKAEIGWVQLEKWIQRMKNLATDKHGQTRTKKR
jgi:hypothetical protein